MAPCKQTANSLICRFVDFYWWKTQQIYMIQYIHSNCLITHQTKLSQSRLYTHNSTHYKCMGINGNSINWIKNRTEMGKHQHNTMLTQAIDIHIIHLYCIAIWCASYLILSCITWGVSRRIRCFNAFLNAIYNLLWRNCDLIKISVMFSCHDPYKIIISKNYIFKWFLPIVIEVLKGIICLIFIVGRGVTMGRGLTRWGQKAYIVR